MEFTHYCIASEACIWGVGKTLSEAVASANQFLDDCVIEAHDDYGNYVVRAEDGSTEWLYSHNDSRQTGQLHYAPCTAAICELVDSSRGWAANEHGIATIPELENDA